MNIMDAAKAVLAIIDHNDVLVNDAVHNALNDLRKAVADAEIEPRKYVPMTDDELAEIDIATGMADPKEPWAYERNIEQAVIKRAGLEYVQKPVQQSEGGDARLAEGQK